MHNDIQKAVAVLKKGGVVAFPTRTSYGFAVDPYNEMAVRRLYALKGRDFNKPVHIISSDIKRIKKLVRWGKTAERLAQNFWPGSLTLVLPLKTSSKSIKILSAGTKTLGVRLTDQKLSQELVNAFGSEITATSANFSGKPNTYSVAEIKKQFKSQKHKPDFYLDGGKLKKLQPSTIIQIDSRHVTLIREGPVKYHDLIKFLK